MFPQRVLSLLRLIYYVPASISLILLCLVPPVYLFIKPLRATSSLPISLALSEMIHVVFVFIPLHYGEPVLCVFRNFFLRFGMATTTAWSLAFNLDLFISMKKPLLKSNVYHKYYHLFVWSYGIIMFILFIIAMIYDTHKASQPFVGFEYCQLGGFGVLFVIQTTSHLLIVFFVFLLMLYAWGVLRKGLPGTHLVRTVTLTRLTFFSIMTMISILFTSFFFFLDYYQKWAFDLAVYLKPITSLLGNSAIAAQAMAVGIFLLTHPVIVERIKQLRKRALDCFLPSIPRSLDPLQETIFQRLPEHILITSDVKMIDEAVRRDVIYQVMLGLTEALKYGRKLQPTPPGQQNSSILRKKRKYYIPQEFDTGIPEIGVLIAQDFLTVQKFGKIKSVTTSKFRFLQYCPRVFRAIRLRLGISDDDFSDSFRPESVILDFIKKNFSEGKSQSFFCATEDGNFIIKTVSKKEKRCLLRVLGSFQKYIFENPFSLIKIPLGLYTLHAHGFTTTFIALQNCMQGHRQMQKRYDLKGSTVARKAGASAPLGKDLDLDAALNMRKFVIPKSQYIKMEQQLQKDAQLFQSLNIMDYSLLLAYQDLDVKENEPIPIHMRKDMPWHLQLDGGILTSDRKRLIRFGVIDVLQEYNTRKKLEHFAKVVFKCANGRNISAVNANDYCHRFTTKIMQYFEPGDEIPSDSITIPTASNPISTSSSGSRKTAGFLSSVRSWFRSGPVEMDEMDHMDMLHARMDQRLTSIHVLDEEDLFDEQESREDVSAAGSINVVEAKEMGLPSEDDNSSGGIFDASFEEENFV